jgi:hypothetical protein
MTKKEVMPDKPLREYQLTRITNIEAWYRRIAAPHVTPGQDSSVRYLLLWTTLNALYNVLDMPKRRLRRPDSTTLRPRLDKRGEDAKLRELARVLAKDVAFASDLLVRHRDFLRRVSRRSPAVTQPDEAEEIHYEVDGQEYVFTPKRARGIASLDRRVILADGHKVYEYSMLNWPISEDAVIADTERFVREALFVLYQIRNNVAHGGAAAFFKRGDKVSEGAMAILDDFVRYMFENHEILLSE